MVRVCSILPAFHSPWAHVTNLSDSTAAVWSVLTPTCSASTWRVGASDVTMGAWESLTLNRTPKSRYKSALFNYGVPRKLPAVADVRLVTA